MSSAAKAVPLRALLLGCLLSTTRVVAATPSVPVLSDPRFELLAIIHSLAAEQKPLRGFKFNALDYSKDAKRRFEPFRRHPAVALYAQAASSGFNFISAADLMANVSAPPELTPRGSLPEDQLKLLKAFSAFARDSSFMDFFGENHDRYADFAQQIEKQQAGRDYPAMLDQYSGMKLAARYAIVVCALCEEPDGINVKALDGPRPTILSLMGPEKVSGGKPVFDYREFRLGMWHELGHTLFDRIETGYAAKLDKTRPLFETVAGCCRSTWEECVREHVAQGVAYAVWDWTRKTKRVDEGPRTLKQNKEPPFIHQVVRRLGEFESDRARYPTLEDFYPRLLDVFSNIQATPAGQGARSSNCRSNSAT